MIRWNNSLQPKKYEIAGTSPDSRILFLNVNIIESTGKEPYIGNVLIEGMFISNPSHIIFSEKRLIVVL